MNLKHPKQQWQVIAPSVNHHRVFQALSANQTESGFQLKQRLYVCLAVQAVLAAIIYVNLHGMMKQFMDIPALWRSNRIDMVSEPEGLW